jgi:regulatory protein
LFEMPNDKTSTYMISALSVQKRNPQRVNVYLDGEFAFGLARIVAAWLHVGQEINDEKIAQLKGEDEFEVAYQRALRQIEYRQRTESEIRKNLSRNEVSEVLQDAVVARLKESRLLDDASFTQSWVENRSELRPRSRRALAFELHQRGVDQSLIDESLEQINDNDLAYQAAQRRVSRFKDLEWPDFRLKMYRFLAQRGFDYESSREAIERVWQEIHTVMPAPGDEEGVT